MCDVPAPSVSVAGAGADAARGRREEARERTARPEGSRADLRRRKSGVAPPSLDGFTRGGPGHAAGQMHTTSPAWFDTENRELATSWRA